MLPSKSKTAVVVASDDLCSNQNFGFIACTPASMTIALNDFFFFSLVCVSVSVILLQLEAGPGGFPSGFYMDIYNTEYLAALLLFIKSSSL